MILSNKEASLLINISKRLVDRIISIPSGKTRIYSASDMEGIKEFLYRMRQASGNTAERQKATYNLFYNGYQLLRLDTDGNGLHTNADGSTIPPHTPHIHIYDEIEGDHDAYLLPECFRSTTDIFMVLLDFLLYTNVVDIEKLEISEQRRLEFHGNR